MDQDALTSRETERTAVRNSKESATYGDKRTSGRNLPNRTEEVKEQKRQVLSRESQNNFEAPKMALSFIKNPSDTSFRNPNHFSQNQASKLKKH